MGAERKDPDDDARETLRFAFPRPDLDDEDLTPARPSQKAQSQRPGSSPRARDGGAGAKPPAPPVGKPGARLGSGPRPAHVTSDEEATQPAIAVTPVPRAEETTEPGVSDTATTVPLGRVGAYGQAQAQPPARAAGQASSQRPPRPAAPVMRPVSPMDRTQIISRPKSRGRARNRTFILHPGPTTKDKLLAFIGMVIFMTTCGIAIIAWRRPDWFGIGPTPTRTRPAAGTRNQANPNRAAGADGPTTNLEGTSPGSVSAPSQR